MRLIVARCSVSYTGRLSTHLPEAMRLIMVTADGSLLIHQDGGHSKPLNWMTPRDRDLGGRRSIVVRKVKGEGTAWTSA